MIFIQKEMKNFVITKLCGFLVKGDSHFITIIPNKNQEMKPKNGSFPLNFTERQNIAFFVFWRCLVHNFQTPSYPKPSVKYLCETILFELSL